MSIRAVLFDAGNTLVEPDYGRMAEVLANFGLPADPADIRTLAGKGRAFLDRFVAEKTGSTEAPHTRTFLLNLLLDNLGFEGGANRDAAVNTLATILPDLWTVPVPGGRRTLLELSRRGFLLGVVSNSDGEVEDRLREAGVEGPFDVIVDSGLEEVEKPDPRIFTLAVNRLDILAERAMYVGDLPSVDVRGARAAGLWPILFDPFDVFASTDVQRTHALEELLDFPVLSNRADSPG